MFGKILSSPLKPVTTCEKAPSQMLDGVLNSSLQPLIIFAKSVGYLFTKFD